MAPIYVGLMSGTSMDGVDAVLARFGQEPVNIELLAHEHAPYSADLRQALVALNIPGANELHRAALAANAISAAYAKLIPPLLQRAGLSREEVCAIGAHGQTVRHQPGLHDATGYTIQLLNGSRLAELAGIDVVCDFRSRDVAAGGQGAPLVPAFHQALFGRTGHVNAILNIGGFSNLTLLDGAGGVGGLDCGPGNIFLDMWCQQHLGTDYDQNGEWSAGGDVHAQLLLNMLSDPFFKQALPKSTGRDLFNRAWLDQHLRACNGSSPPSERDVQATLAQLSARTIAEMLIQHLPEARELFVCGGGALNSDLCRRLQKLLPDIVLRSTSEAGISVMQVEAAAFAWLAARHVHQQTGNSRTVTGATGDRILGCRYPA